MELRSFGLIHVLLSEANPAPEVEGRKKQPFIVTGAIAQVVEVKGKPHLSMTTWAPFEGFGNTCKSEVALSPGVQTVEFATGVFNNSDWFRIVRVIDGTQPLQTILSPETPAKAVTK